VPAAHIFRVFILKMLFEKYKEHVMQRFNFACDIVWV
jgi:hypothetical protein